MSDRDDEKTPVGGARPRIAPDYPPPPPWHDVPDTSWPATNGTRKVVAGVLVVLIASGIGGAVLTYSQARSNGEQIQEVRDRQDRHERRGHSGTARDVAETREDVSDVKGEIKAIKAKIESVETNAEETRDDVRWIRRRMGGGR